MPYDMSCLLESQLNFSARNISHKKKNILCFKYSGVLSFLEGSKIGL